MEAKASPVSNLIKVELCPDCPLRELLDEEPKYILNGGGIISEMNTRIDLLSDKEQASEVIEGVRTTPMLIEAFDNCKEPVGDSTRQLGKLICGAVSTFRRNEINRPLI